MMPLLTGTVTVIGDLPDAPFSEAVMEVEPAATPVARPAELIVATAVLAEAQVAVAVTSAVVPSGFFTVAVNCCVAPTMTEAGLGETEIPVTFSAALPLTLFSEAVTVAEPAATAVASPAELMVATAVLSIVQAAVAVTFLVDPSLYFAVAVNCCVAPVPMFAGLGATEIVESVGVTVRVAGALTTVPTEAVRVVEPAATPVARPDAFTVTTAGFALLQVTVPVTSACVPSL